MSLTFIGGGNMASAMIGGLIAKQHPPAGIRVVEIDPAARERLLKRGVACFGEIGPPALAGTQLVVLAVKPQQMREIAMQLGPHLLTGQTVLSIAAGIRLADLARWLGARDCTFVRAMPNTPALIGEGITGLYRLPPKYPLAQDRIAMIERVIGAIGQLIWIDDERQMDAVTAISGSGPAYVFYFIEALEQAAARLGLPPDTARKLAVATCAGAAKLAAASGESPSVLRERVTSKGGTTEAALRVFAAKDLAAIVAEAAQAAAERGRELGAELGKD